MVTSNSRSRLLARHPTLEPAGGGMWTAGQRARMAVFGVLVLFLAAALTVATVVVFFVPGIPFVVIAPELDYVTNTAATLIAGAVGVLAWVRSRETIEPDALYQASAFFTLFVGGAIAIVLLLSDSATRAGFDRAAPGQAPLYLWTAQRLLASMLLLVGAAAALWRWPRLAPRRAAVVAMVPGAVLIMLTAVVLVVRPRLPELVPPDDLAAVTAAIDVLDPAILSGSLISAQFALAALFSIAAGAYFLLYRRERGSRPYLAYLCIALVMAAFSQVHFAFVPGAYSGLLTSGDILRLAFYVLLGLGLVAGWRHDLRELRQANHHLVRLRAVDAERVALEERARMARDVHDGLVQELWLARLTHGQLVRALATAGGSTNGLSVAARRVDSILEEALAEARQVVVTLQPHDHDGFGGLLARFVEDYADRFGLDVECSISRDPMDLPTEQQGEILRICREALNNARKHADATVVLVTLEQLPEALRLTVADDGAGFDPVDARRGFGLQSMQDRAARIGGKLEIESVPTRGTRVVFDLPVNL